MKVLAVIPSRYASTRFPGKPLAEIGGKTMIQRVYEQVEKATQIDKVLVATDDERIYNHVMEFGGGVVMTAPHHQNGTERCAEVIETVYDDFEVVLNIQGDEPFIMPEQVDQLVKCFDDEYTEIATLIKQTSDHNLLFSPNTAKVVYNEDFKALYFSRQPIPHLRGVRQEEWAARRLHHLHLGVYGYRKEVLREIVKLPLSTLESLEMLEQLRWLENGYHITVRLTDFQSVAIDTPNDLMTAEKFLQHFPQFS
jgi:3-deoxy-manno-octulosonate cytidylyltransferase (CMP-KDO synthetase)